MQPGAMVSDDATWPSCPDARPILVEAALEHGTTSKLHDHAPPDYCRGALFVVIQPRDPGPFAIRLHEALHMKRARFPATLSLATIAVVLALLPSPAAAIIYLVTNANDSGTGSLRQKIADAGANSPGPHTILFDIAANSVITLGSRLQIPANLNLTIDATAPIGITLDGDNGTRLIQVGSGARLTLKGLVVRNGRSTDDAGGCISSPDSSAFLRLESVVVRGCSNQQTSGTAIAGAVYAYSPLYIVNSRFESNSARSSGGQAYGGAIVSVGTLEITDTTFTGNEASATTIEAAGGALEARAGGRLSNVHFVDNRASAGAAGVLTLGGAVRSRTTSELRIERSLFVANSARQGAAFEVQGVSGFITRLGVHDSNIVGNLGGVAASLLNVHSDVRNTTFWKNEGGAETAAHLRIAGSQSVIDAFTHNLLAEVDGPLPACDLAGVPAGQDGSGSNLFADASCTALALDSTVWTGPFRIRALRRPDGAAGGVPAVELFAGSPAIDGGVTDPAAVAAAARCTGSDVRGLARPRDGDADGLAGCDIGALETAREASLFADDFDAVLLR